MSKTIADLMFGGEYLKGEVGIEIEVEGRNIPGTIGSSRNKRYWRTERDGSLRGESAEYVLKEPIPRSEVDAALTSLYTAFQANQAAFDDTGRAGVHVHVNVRDLNKDQVFAFILLYLVFERVLVQYCGKEREGNLFCLRAIDAEYLMCLIRKGILEDTLELFHTDDIRYASINLNALAKYGSLEFRGMRSPVEQEVVDTWTQLLLKVKDASTMYADPSTIVMGVSQAGGYEFARSVFGDLVDELECNDWGAAVMSGMRLIQPLAVAYRDTRELREEREAKRAAREAKLESVRTRSQEINDRVLRLVQSHHLPDWHDGTGYYTLGA